MIAVSGGTSAATCHSGLGGRRATVIALAPADGHVVWQTDVPAVVAVVPPQTADEVRFNLAGSHTIVRLDSMTGANLGTVKVDGPLTVGLTMLPPVGFGAVIVDRAFDDQGSFVSGTDSASGGRLWTTRLPRSGGGTKVVATDGLAVVASSDEIPACP
jgi:outer membrane protein assembly factor BamB